MQKELIFLSFILLVMQEIRLNLHSEPDGPFTGNGAFKSSILMPGYTLLAHLPVYTFVAAALVL